MKDRLSVDPYGFEPRSFSSSVKSGGILSEKERGERGNRLHTLPGGVVVEGTEREIRSQGLDLALGCAVVVVGLLDLRLDLLPAVRDLECGRDGVDEVLGDADRAHVERHDLGREDAVLDGDERAHELRRAERLLVEAVDVLGAEGLLEPVVDGLDALPAVGLGLDVEERDVPLLLRLGQERRGREVLRHVVTEDRLDLGPRDGRRAQLVADDEGVALAAALPDVALRLAGEGVERDRVRLVHAGRAAAAADVEAGEPLVHPVVGLELAELEGRAVVVVRHRGVADLGLLLARRTEARDAVEEPDESAARQLGGHVPHRAGRVEEHDDREWVRVGVARERLSGLDPMRAHALVGTVPVEDLGRRLVRARRGPGTELFEIRHSTTHEGILLFLF